MPRSARSPQLIGIETRVNAKNVKQYRGTVPDRGRKGRKLRGPWTETLAAARAWRNDALGRLDDLARRDVGPLLGTTADVFLAGMREGVVLNRSGRPFKPSVIVGYSTSLTRMKARLGEGMPLAHFDPTVLQTIIDERTLVAAPSTVANDITALRSLFAWARRRHRELHERDPFKGLQLPRGETPRERIAPPEEMALLIAALDMKDRALLGLGAYAGLRRGEILALAREHIDLKARMIHVRIAWDPNAGEFVELKTRNGIRSVPIVQRLVILLEDHLEAMPDGQQLLFVGKRGVERPLRPSDFHDRARERWEALALDPIGLHEARHTFASTSIAAGVNAKALSTYMGHGSIQITYDRYGHLMPGNEAEALLLMDAYMERT